MAKYMLITVIEREILTEQFETKKAAKTQMLKELALYSQEDVDELLTTSVFDDGKMGFGEDSAYLNDGLNHDNYDWRIVAL